MTTTAVLCCQGKLPFWAAAYPQDCHNASSSTDSTSTVQCCLCSTSFLEHYSALAAVYFILVMPAVVMEAAASYCAQVLPAPGTVPTCCVCAHGSHLILRHVSTSLLPTTPVMMQKVGQKHRGATCRSAPSVAVTRQHAPPANWPAALYCIQCC